MPPEPPNSNLFNQFSRCSVLFQYLIPLGSFQFGVCDCKGTRLPNLGELVDPLSWWFHGLRVPEEIGETAGVDRATHFSDYCGAQHSPATDQDFPCTYMDTAGMVVRRQ